MLFVVGDDAAHELDAPSGAYVTSAFGRLLRSVLDGEHLLVLARERCRQIESSGAFSDAERAAAAKVRAKFAELGGLSDRVLHHAIVVADGDAPVRRGNGWEIPLRWLASNSLSETELLCEDLNDAHCYAAAGQDYLALNGLHAFRIRARPISGGGGNTHRVLRATAIDAQKICLCIVDSDAQFPGGNLGPTAQACLRVAGSGIFEVSITPGRSIENLIPWRLLDFVRQTPPRPSALLGALAGTVPESVLFLNLKTGMRGHDISSIEAGDAKEFWEHVATAAVGASCCPAGCHAVDRNQCGYLVFSGLGAALVADVVKWLRENPAFHRAKQYMPSPNGGHWSSLGELVAAYALGTVRHRI